MRDGKQRHSGLEDGWVAKLIVLVGKNVKNHCCRCFTGHEASHKLQDTSYSQFI